MKISVQHLHMVYPSGKEALGDVSITLENAFFTSRINALYAENREALQQKGYDASAYQYALDFEGFQENMYLFEQMAKAQNAEDVAALLDNACVRPVADPPEDVVAAFADVVERAGLPLHGNTYYSQPGLDPAATWQMLSCADATVEDIEMGIVPYVLVKLDESLQLTYMVSGQMYDPVAAGTAGEEAIQAAIDTAEAFLSQGVPFVRGTGEAKTSANLYSSLNGEAFLWVWVPDDTAEQLGDTQHQYGARLAVGTESGAVLDMLLDVDSELVMK